MKLPPHLSIASLVVLCVIVVVVQGRETEVEQAQTIHVAAPDARLRAFMRKKLVAADHVMEGLATPNYELIRKGATELIHMSKAALWETHAGPAYSQDSADFVRSAERLIKQANEKDLEGASHTYAHLTIRCIDCHRRIRGQKIASLPVGDSAELLSQLLTNGKVVQ